VLIEAVISDFLRHIRYEKRMSLHTCTAYENDLQQLQHYLQQDFDIVAMEALQFLHLRSWLASGKEQDLAARTLQRKMSAAKSLCKFAMRMGYISSNPSINIKAPKAPKRLPIYLESDDTVAMLEALPFSEGIAGLTDRLILELLYQAGLRRAELVQLKETDVEFARGQIRVFGKRNKERLIPLSEALMHDIKEYITEKRKLFNVLPDNLLVLESGLAIYDQYVYRIVRKYLSLITTLSKKSPHVLRHTFATQLSNNGAALNAIKDLLGHSSLASTQVYTHTNIDRLKDVYRKAHPKR
jgi:integrase/recombinase XerC